MNSVDEDWSHFMDIPLPKASSKVVRGRVNLGGVYIEYISKDKCRLRILANGSPQLKIIPQWLINLVTRKMAYTVLLKLKKIFHTVKDLGHDKRIADNKHFYDKVRARLHLLAL